MKRPFHKHIAHHTKRYTKHLTKYLYERDTIYATISVFLLLFLLNMIPINFYVLNPMKMALKDFDFNDIAYSKLVNNDKIKQDSNITLVNFGHMDREGIAYLLEKLNSMKPKVIGLDALFEGEREPEKDSVLRNVFLNNPNIIVVSRVLFDEKKEAFIDSNFFDKEIKKRGAANLVGEEIGTIRYYVPFEKLNGQDYPHITSAIVKEFDSAAYTKLKKRGKELEAINYARRVDKYQVVLAEDLMNDMVEERLIKDRIILVGYLSDKVDDIEDKKFTPMNEKFAGKSKPDMNGIVVQANIISMVLKGNYINKMPVWVALIFAALIGWLHMSLYIRFYLEDHIWFHLVAKLTQVFSVIFFAYLGMIIYDKFRVKLDMKYTLYVIALAVDVIYFYEALATWMHKKFGYATIFAHHHHHEHGSDHKEHHTPASPDAHHH